MSGHTRLADGARPPKFFAPLFLGFMVTKLLGQCLGTKGSQTAQGHPNSSHPPLLSTRGGLEHLKLMTLFHLHRLTNLFSDTIGSAKVRAERESLAPFSRAYLWLARQHQLAQALALALAQVLAQALAMAQALGWHGTQPTPGMVVWESSLAGTENRSGASLQVWLHLLIREEGTSGLADVVSTMNTNKGISAGS